MFYIILYLPIFPRVIHHLADTETDIFFPALLNAEEDSLFANFDSMVLSSNLQHKTGTNGELLNKRLQRYAVRIAVFTVAKTHFAILPRNTIHGVSRFSFLRHRQYLTIGVLVQVSALYFFFHLLGSNKPHIPVQIEQAIAIFIVVPYDEAVFVLLKVLQLPAVLHNYSKRTINVAQHHQNILNSGGAVLFACQFEYGDIMNWPGSVSTIQRPISQA